ncbi:MAG: hypothetical protein ACTMID_13525, partial [Cellulosimicrobium funkei]
MDDDGTPSPEPATDPGTGTGTGTGTVPPRARRRGPLVAVAAAGVGGVLAVVAAVVGPAALRTAAEQPAPATSSVAPTTPAPGATPAPTSPESDREAVAVRLRALPGVAAVEALGTAGESARITLVGPLPTPEEAQRTADDASAIVAAVPGGGAWSLRVEG